MSQSHIYGYTARPKEQVRPVEYAYRLPPASLGVPSYAVLSQETTGKASCGCSGRCGDQGCGGSGMVSDVSGAVRDNPILFLIGAFALGYCLKGRK